MKAHRRSPLLLCLLCAPAAADMDTTAPLLSLDVAAEVLTAAQPPTDKAAADGPTDGTPGPATPAKPDFGLLRSGAQDRAWFLTTGVGFAPGIGGEEGDHAGAFVSCSTFVGNDLELQFELNAWYFSQDPDDTAGAGFTVNLRWHVWHGTYQSESQGGSGLSARDWTVFFDAGIGLIASGDDVPDGGSSLNLAPRVGTGFTARLGESHTRLVGGVRWHHMSNARFNGDDENPDFNAPYFYLGLQWPM